MISSRDGTRLALQTGKPNYTDLSQNKSGDDRYRYSYNVCDIIDALSGKVGGTKTTTHIAAYTISVRRLVTHEIMYTQCYYTIHVRYAHNLEQFQLLWQTLMHPPSSASACVMVAQRFGRRTFDQAIVGSIPGRGVIRAPRSTQSSIPPG